MASSTTKNLRLQKPATSDRNWDVPLNSNADLLDGLTAIGNLMVTTAEFPSASLLVRVAGGSFVKADGSIGVFAGSTSIALPPSATICLWLTDAGTVVSGSTYPTTAHLRLARVTSSTSTILQVTDDRVQCAISGTGLGFVAKTGDTVSGTFVVVTPASGTALLNLDALNRQIGFFGAAPASQASAMTLLAALAGTASDTINDVGSSHSQTVLNNNFASLTAKVDALIVALKRHGLMAS